jgi:hypothetical protein
MSRPSPLRKIVPLLVWPVGIMLIVGYCTLTRRSTDAPERRTTVVTSTGERINTTSSGVAVALEPARTLDLRIAFAVVLGIILVAWVSRVARRDPGARDRDDGGSG